MIEPFAYELREQACRALILALDDYRRGGSTKEALEVDQIECETREQALRMLLRRAVVNESGLARAAYLSRLRLSAQPPLPK